MTDRPGATGSDQSDPAHADRPDDAGASPTGSETAPDDAETAPPDEAAAAGGGATTGDPHGDAEAGAADVPAWERRRRLAEVFGDVLPDTTRDERGGGGDRDEEWYRRETPPHHGS